MSADAADAGYAAVYRFAALHRAFRRARRTKRGRGGEPAFYRDLEDNLLALSDALRTRTFRPDPYRYFRLRGHKDRVVAEASFRDRVVHHALVATLEPSFEARFIRHSYACRKGRGVHAALRTAQRLARRLPYFLKMDVRKYFDRVHHTTLLERLASVVRSPGSLWLCETLLDGAGVPGVPAGERRGLPIGNLTSQFWANVYLDPLDHHVRDDLGFTAYARFMDDILVLAHRKEALWEACAAIRAYAHEHLGLTMKDEVTTVATRSGSPPPAGGGSAASCAGRYAARSRAAWPMNARWRARPVSAGT